MLKKYLKAEHSQEKEGRTTLQPEDRDGARPGRAQAWPSLSLDWSLEAAFRLLFGSRSFHGFPSFLHYPFRIGS